MLTTNIINMRFIYLYWVVVIVTILFATSNCLGTDELYRISWNGQFPSDDTKTSPSPDDTIRISTSDNEKYLCVMPDATLGASNGINPKLKQQNSLDNSSDLTDSKYEYVNSTVQDKNPLQLLFPLLKGDMCSYKYELYWVYELCHGKFLRQFHEEASKFRAKTTQQFFLGRMDSEDLKRHEVEYNLEEERRDTTTDGGTPLKRPTILVDGVAKPYVSVNMTDGTVCDLTMKNRSTKVIYVCGGGLKNEVYSIKETSTCEYEAIVLTPHICQHKDFMIESSKEKEIKCYSLDGAPLKPKKVLDPKDEEDLAKADSSMAGKRILTLDTDLFYLVNLVQT